MQNSLHSNQHESSYGYGDETPTASKVSLPEPATGPAGGDMSSRFDDLARREQELAAREAQLNAKAEHIRKVSRLVKVQTSARRGGGSCTLESPSCS